MSRGIFITGTDTGVGKTCFTVSLMETLKKQGIKVAGMKPIASGATLQNGKLINEDAELIMEHCSEATDYELINPVVYELAVSPHIAANQEKVVPELSQVIDCFKKLESACEIVVVEGVGGWRVPISDNLSLVDLVHALDLPVILVVGLKLGCINHAILTAEAIRADGLNLIGWVSNHLDKEYRFAHETIETLNVALACPNIADLPFISNFQTDKSIESIHFCIDLPL